MKKLISIILFGSLIITSKLNLIISDDEGLQPPFVINNLTEGLDTDTATSLTFASPNLYNTILDETSALKMRQGSSLAYTVPVSSTTQLLNSFSAVYDDGSSEFIVHAGSGIYSISGDNTNWVLIVNGVSSKFMMNFAMINGEVWMTDGVDDVGVWDRVSYISYSFIPKGRYIVADKEQILMAGMFEDPSAIRFSNLFNSNATYSDAKTIYDWAAYNRLPCGIGDGDMITGLFKKDNKVYATKKKSIYGIFTNNNYADVYNTQIYLYTSLYGSVSQRSISNYKDYSILLDKSGLIAYNGGNSAEIISKNISDITDIIKVVNTNYGRWTATSQTDFSTGTFVNCYNNVGTIEISTSVKTWTATADFANGASGTSQVDTSNNEVKITTYVVGGYTKLTLTYGEEKSASGVDDTTSKFVLPFGPIAHGGDKDASVDSDDGTFLGLIYTEDNKDLWATWRTSATDCPINKIRIRFKKSGFAYSGGALGNDVGTKFFDDNLWYPYFVSSSVDLTDSQNVVKSSLGDIVKYYDDFTWNDWIWTSLLTPINAFKIRITARSYIFDKYTQVNSIGQDPYRSSHYPIIDARRPPWFDKNILRIPLFSTIDYNALLIYDISAYQLNAEMKLYTSGTYISPNFTGAGATGQYQYLYVGDWLSHIGSASSDTIKYYASNNNSTWTYLGLSTGSFTVFPISSNTLDNNTNFYWKSELWTSSITATPIVQEVSLQYATTNYATYRTAVKYIGNKVSSIDTFLASYEGTVLFRIRASSKTYDKDIATLSESGANQWTYITSGQDLSNVITSTSNCFIQTEVQLKSKNAKLNSLTFTWTEGNETTNITQQDVASINYKGKYYVAYSTWASYNTDVLVFDKNGKFTRYDWDVSGWVECSNKLYFLSSTSNKIYQALTGTTDNGTPISMLWQSPDYDCGLPNLAKEYKHIYITGKKQAGSFAYVDTYIDYSTYTVKSIYCDLANDSNFRLQMNDQSYGKNIRLVVRSTAPVCEIDPNIFIYYKIKPLGIEPAR